VKIGPTVTPAADRWITANAIEPLRERLMKLLVA
jgi:hypothetical protein